MLISPQFQASLRTRFNPDGSPLRAHQLRMLEMLVYIDGLCRANGIPYWLSSGTLIGAVRHGGYIPWDDDVDIEMLHADYLRLVDAIARDTAPGGTAHGRYVLQTRATDKGYIFYYAKLRDTRSFMLEDTGLDATQHYHGCYIDIFTLSPSSSRLLSRLSCKMLGTELKYLVRYGNTGLRCRLLSGMMRTIVYPAMKLADRTGVMLTGSRRLRHTLPSYFPKERNAADLMPLTEIEFEGHSFLAPRDTDAYLRRIYGDYTQLPDIDKIVPHTSRVRIF